MIKTFFLHLDGSFPEKDTEEIFFCFKRRKEIQFTTSPSLLSPVECVIKVLVILYETFPLTPETQNAGLLSFIVPPSDNKETRNILKQSPGQRLQTGPPNLGTHWLLDYN